MDPISIAATAMAILSPYIKKGVQEMTGAAAEVAYQKSKQLLVTLKQKWFGDSEAVQAVQHFEQKPEVYQAVLEDTLRTKLAQDQQFASELQNLLEQMGPSVSVTQVIRDGDEATGLKASAVAGGRLTVDQQTTNVKKSIGAELGDIGPRTSH
jgi:hypothetical protein